MSFPNCHKTVIVLDRSLYFLESSKQPMDFDMFIKAKAPGLIPLAPILKSLWTCNIEAVLEYVRIVFDIFPSDKLIELIVSETQAYSLNSWNQQEQNLQHMTNRLARLPPPNTTGHNLSSEYNIFQGINQAVEELCQPSKIQHEVRTSLTELAATCVNKGRIVCLSSFKNDDFIYKLEEYTQNVLIQHNKAAASTDILLPIDHCELVLIDTVPVGHHSSCSNQRKRQLSLILNSEIHTSRSGKDIAIKMVELVMDHFQLSSTTVTGIPMKEEQNAMSSANYDVELLHSSDAHLDLIRSGHHEGLVAQSKEGLYTNTITLKWCTPRTTCIELQQCTGAYRITPVDVNSRPSSCLTNFLLSGRSVMLEQPRKTGNKLISHMLTSHGGEIFIHVLATLRSMLEDPPSISEGAGGRLTDYRINDFGEFMKENRLAPFASSLHLSILPLTQATQQIERMTRFWPMVISDTIIFKMISIIDPLPSLITKERLTEAEVLECKKVIYHVVGMESRNEPLPVPASGVRGKGCKRDEQYRQMWNEFERLMRAHSSTSIMHKKVLECLLECKKPSSDDIHHLSQLPKMKDEKVLLETSSVDRFLKDKQETVKLLVDVKREIELSQNKPKKLKTRFEQSGSTISKQSCLSLLSNRINTLQKSSCQEFHGRQNGSESKAELYRHLKETANGDGSFEKNGANRNKTQ